MSVQPIVNLDLEGKVKWNRLTAVRIGELARLAGITTKALRFYEEVGLLPCPDRTPSGYRDETTDQLGPVDM